MRRILHFTRFAKVPGFSCELILHVFPLHLVAGCLYKANTQDWYLPRHRFCLFPRPAGVDRLWFLKWQTHSIPGTALCQTFGFSTFAIQEVIGKHVVEILTAQTSTTRPGTSGRPSPQGFLSMMICARAIHSYYKRNW